MIQRFRDKTVLITGAASGLGAECALQFAQAGANLVLIDLNIEKLDTLRTQLAGAPVVTLAGNVAEPSTAEESVALAEEKFGRLDVLISNAAVDPLTAGSVLETSDADWQTVMNVNLTAAFFFARASIGAMSRSKGGSIIAISSISALKPTPSEAVYSVSKAALVQLMRCIALDHAKDKIRANTICPGYLEAVMTDRRSAMGDVKLLERASNVAMAVPLGRHGQYAEIARAVLFLADPSESGYVTGTVLTIDGGVLLT